MSAVATLVCALVIAGLFWLDRDRKARTSAGLWIPVLWLSLSGSRAVSQWLQMDQGMNPEELLEGSPMDAAAYMCLLAAGLVVLLTRRERVARLLRANGAILFFLLYCAISLFWSEYPQVALKRWPKTLGDFVMVLVVLSERQWLDAVIRLLARPTYVLIPLSIVFIKYYSAFGRSYSPWDGEVVFTGVTTNKNTLGVICLLFGLGTLWRLLAAYRDEVGLERTRRLLAHGVVLAMVAWLFWMVDSMTALGCFVIASAMLVVANHQVVIRNPRVVHFLVATLVSIAISILFVVPQLLAMVGRDPTLTDRTAVWSALLELTPNAWIGTGFESFWLGPRLETMWSLYSWGPKQAHNGYLEIFINLGWVGVALLALVLVRGYRTVVAAYRSGLPIGSLWLAFFVVGVTYNVTEAAFFRMMHPVWILFLLAITRVPDLPPGRVPEWWRASSVEDWTSSVSEREIETASATDRRSWAP